MSELSGAIRFLGAFTAIENHSRWKLHDQTSGLVKMAETYAKRYGISLDLRALRTFAELRNALVHNDFYDGKPIADPVPEVVERIESLRDKIISPPTVLSVIPHAVTSFGPDDPLSSVLEEIRNHN
jgi:hypothetical protein